MDDLVTWLKAQVDEDVRRATAAFSGQCDPENGWGIEGRAITPHVGVIHEDVQREHVAKWNPARVLAECEAKRRLMKRGGPFCDCYEGNPPMDPSTNWTVPIPHHYDCSAYEAAKVLAAPYADRPGYREEWRP